METHELRNQHGDRILLLDFGARIMALELQLSSDTRSIVLGYRSPEEYHHDPNFLGCTVGRFANRIGNAYYTLGHHKIDLAANEGCHQLHGGPEGFDKKTWTLSRNSDKRQASYSLLSCDGDQGHPGNLRATVTYRWSDDRELVIDYEATTDSATHVNLTHHSYFQLDEGGDVRNQKLAINSEYYTEVDQELIPTGRLLRVPAQFAGKPAYIRELLTSIGSAEPAGKGLDYNFVLRSEEAARLISSSGDLEMSVTTTYPGMQVYTAQKLTAPFTSYGAICLEPQFFPDTPNRPEFPSTLLLPGQQWRHQVRYQFLESVGTTESLP